MPAGTMPVRYQALWLPKRGHAADEYEDACAGDPVAGRFALADGASESSFAGRWAELLVRDFVEAPAGPDGAWAARLPPLQGRWVAEVGGRSLSWYAEAKFELGAFATFLGLVLEGNGPGQWRALAVGDSCLFQVRAGRLQVAFPVTHFADFGNTPSLVGARTPAADVATKQEIRSGDWQPGDHLWLMTDALAHWFLGQAEADRRPWEALEAVLAAPVPAAAFAGWVEHLWDARELRNDDITLMAVG
jgi:hypothetical protein